LVFIVSNLTILGLGKLAETLSLSLSIYIYISMLYKAVMLLFRGELPDKLFMHRPTCKSPSSQCDDALFFSTLNDVEQGVQILATGFKFHD
jgi:hypothetical protein